MKTLFKFSMTVADMAAGGMPCRRAKPSKSAGFSLDEIAGMFGHNGIRDPPRDVLHEKADAMDRSRN